MWSVVGLLFVGHDRLDKFMTLVRKCVAQALQYAASKAWAPAFVKALTDSFAAHLLNVKTTNARGVCHALPPARPCPAPLCPSAPVLTARRRALRWMRRVCVCLQLLLHTTDLFLTELAQVCANASPVFSALRRMHCTDHALFCASPNALLTARSRVWFAEQAIAVRSVRSAD
jgi:hypothetical protein